MENRHYCSRQKVLQMIQIENDCRILILWQSAIRFVNFTVVCGPSLNETCDNCVQLSLTLGSVADYRCRYWLCWNWDSLGSITGSTAHYQEERSAARHTAEWRPGLNGLRSRLIVQSHNWAVEPYILHHIDSVITKIFITYIFYMALVACDCSDNVSASGENVFHHCSC